MPFSTTPGDDNPTISNATDGYLGYLALSIRPTQESFVDDFAAKTLKLLGFTLGTRAYGN